MLEKKKKYYMASSANGQDEPNRALWLPTRACKVEPSCPLGTTRCIPQAEFHQKPLINLVIRSWINLLLTKFVRSRWLDIGLVLSYASLWISTSCLSINTQKKNLTNIQPPWPHTWSITHTYLIDSSNREFGTLVEGTAEENPKW